MKVKKDLEFTPPLDEYVRPEMDTNHVSKDEFHQVSSSEPETPRRRKGWKRKLRHMLTAGAAAVVVVTVSGVGTAGKENWVEFDIEINGIQFHLPCQLSTALDFAKGQGHPLEQQWEGSYWFENDVGFQVGAYGEGSVWQYLWTGIQLQPGLENQGELFFDYKGITEQSTWEECVSVLGIPHEYFIIQETDVPRQIWAIWYSDNSEGEKDSPEVRANFFYDRMDQFYLSANNWGMEFTDENVKSWKEEEVEKWFSIRCFIDGEVDESIKSEAWLEGVYIFETTEDMPDKINDLPGENILEGKGMKHDDTIWVPKPEFENWSIALVYELPDNESDGGHLNEKYAHIYTYADKEFTRPGGHIEFCIFPPIVDGGRYFGEISMD